MSTEDLRSPNPRPTQRFVGLGRLLADDKWLGEFSENINQVTQGYDLEFKPEITPAIFYVTKGAINRSTSQAEAPMLEGLQRTSQVIAEVINANMVDRRIAIRGLSVTLGNFTFKNIPEKGKGYGDSADKFYGISASFQDDIGRGDRSAALIDNERAVFRKVYGAEPPQTDRNGLPIIKMRLGTLRHRTDIKREFGENDCDELYELSSKNLHFRQITGLW